MQSTEDRPSKRARKACTECRQQKARCDASLSPGEPCSRCRKMKIQCVISDPFKREHRRKKLSELEKETAALRKRLESTSQPASTGSTSPDTATSAHQSPVTNGHDHGNPLHPLATQVPLPLDPTGPESIDNRPLVPHVHVPPGEPTSTQVLDGLELEGPEIDELFHKFFSSYARFLPILDPSRSPNSYYAESPFLFWAIVGVGSRWHRRSDLIMSLAPKVINLACVSLQYTSKQSVIPIIKAFLIILTWPFPRGAHETETTFPFAGTLIHMALQIGLHIPAATQDFSRVKVKLTQEDITNRYELWAHCVLVYQRSCSLIGQYPASVFDRSHEHDSIMNAHIAPSLRFQVELHRLERRCCAAMQNINLRKLPPEAEKTLDILIKVFEAQVRDLESQITTDFDRLYYCMTRLMINMFHFYKAALPADLTAATRVYATACETIEQMKRLDHLGPDTLRSSPVYATFALSMSLLCVVRLVKTSFAQYVDADNAKSTIMQGLEVGKRLSVGNRDISSKLVPAINQLWNSERAFRKPDGSEFSALRIRTRMFMSPVYDALWWWREEFQGQAGAYPPSNEEEQQPPATNVAPTSNDISLGTAAPPDQASIWFGFMEPYHYPNDQSFAEFGWPLDFDMNGAFDAGNNPGWPS